MRERLLGMTGIQYSNGITPAYAGKTNVRYSSHGIRQDHPRVCGKDEWLIDFAFTNGGSPPRMRERLNAFSIASKTEGITPAYAGKTKKPSRILPCRRDHPRVCGKDF